MRTDSASGIHVSDVVHRAIEAELDDVRAARRRPHVVDVGGGSGVWAVPLAASGCDVTVVEPNPNAIATLSTRAAEEGVTDAVHIVADDVDALAQQVAAKTADLVLAHGLLEVVDDPVSAVASLATVLADGGTVSVLAANRHAATLHRALAGRFDEALDLLRAPHGVLDAEGETLERRFDSGSLEALLADAGLRVTLVQGDGVVADSAGDGGVGDLEEFEHAAAATPPLRDIATRLHVLARSEG